MQIPWYITALGAALIWGLHYPLIDHALKKISLFSVLLITVIPVLLIAPLFSDTLLHDYETFKALETTQKLTISAIGLTSLLASILLFMSIGSKNATLASLIEITYPVFVALFSFILFKHLHINASVITGGILVMAGAGIIILNN
ncbi:MAG: DMT family transporter [Gammaproteobacteria bacterium]|nr:DMT family transporter [Gammaproteobacteria bacterium]MDH5736073.1 DMT family transporter [Gammaproteobacteria bacterium]